MASNSYYADNITFNTEGCANFTLMQQGTTIGTISLNVPGEHNVLNAVAASALALELKLPFRSIQTALSCFGAPARRFEHKGSLGGITIVDDYAHHPTEIAFGCQKLRQTSHRLRIPTPYLFPD